MRLLGRFALLAIVSGFSNLLFAQVDPSSSMYGGNEGVATAPNTQASINDSRAFSRIAFGARISPLGIGAEVTTNLNPRINLRASGSFFSQGIQFNSNGFQTTANLKLASTRTSIDVYPFRAGFRISPGAMFYNQNRVTASDTIAGGSSFTLNGDTFYSATANQATGATPVNGTALLNLHATRPAFTLTGGWGNEVVRRGHWSFPVEVGVGFVGAPKLDVNLRGWACHDQAQTECTDIANPNNSIAVQVQSDLNAEVSKWTSDLEPLKTYPIVSAGVSYSFRTGRR
ncbi:MAG TPA: hypothetical protein VGF82_15750 [Terracidiphilus sp.]|jgi:hypothetical protein